MKEELTKSATDVFEGFPANARVWVYQSDRTFSQEEQVSIQTVLNSFTQQWDAHGASLKSVGSILYDHFIVLMVDESQHAVSGCSIDKSVHLMKDLEQQFGVELMNPMKVAFWMDEQIHIGSKKEILSLIEANKINGQSLMFNNSIINKEAWETQWQIPLTDSWLGRWIKDKK